VIHGPHLRRLLDYVVGCSDAPAFPWDLAWMALWNAMMHSRGSELLRPVSAAASHGFLLRLLQRYNDDCFDDIWTSQDEANLSLLNAPQSSHLSLHFVACNRQLRRRSTGTQTASQPQMVVLSASPPHGMRSGGLSSTAGTDESSIF
jgi:hypothetical protein